jgi:GT2 family glycosyltransferase
MRISIITVVLNDPRVERAIASVLAQQTEHELELIIIDGGSGEPTRSILERYVDPHVLQDIATLFQHSDIDACYGDVVFLTPQGRLLRYWHAGAYRPWKYLLGWMPPHQTFFARRQLYERFGGFDLRYRIAADYELMLRLLLRHRIRVGYIPRVLVAMDAGGVSNASLRNILRGNWECWQAWRRNGLSGSFAVPLLKPLRRLGQLVRRPVPQLRFPLHFPPIGAAGSQSSPAQRST